jgi:hypothetical protein
MHEAFGAIVWLCYFPLCVCVRVMVSGVASVLTVSGDVMIWGGWFRVPACEHMCEWIVLKGITSIVSVSNYVIIGVRSQSW